MSKKETKIITVNLAREMIKAAKIDYSNGNHKSIVSIDFIERLMHRYHQFKINNLGVLADGVRSSDEIKKASDIIYNNKSLTYGYREESIAILDWALGGEEFDGLDGMFYCHEDTGNNDRCKSQCDYCSKMTKQ